jgi:nucleotide-binding universal stress UspA family protein
MKTVLVCTDFSPNAFMAARFAAFLAGSRSWQLRICHAYWPFSSGFQGEMQNQRDKEMASDDACKRIDMFVQRLKQLYPGVQMEGCCLLGRVNEVIPEEAEKEGAVLIVMGTQGASGLKYTLLGSNTFSIIQKSGVHVLAVPGGIRKFSFNRIGFTTNFHAVEITALHDFISLAGDETEIIPFHLYSANQQLEETKMNAWKSKASNMISNRSLMFRLSRMRSHTAGIRSFIKKEKLDALVMTSIDKGFFTRLLDRDLIKAVAHQCTIPVMFMKEK